MPRVASRPDLRPMEREARNAKLPETVLCRVLEKGDGLIYTGEVEKGPDGVTDKIGGMCLCYEVGEEFECPKITALIHEDRGYIEIIRSK